MATKGYILVETGIGKTREVVTVLRGLPGINSADQVAGPYDVIVVAEAKDVSALGELVTTKIRAVAGVTRTVTCLAI